MRVAGEIEPELVVIADRIHHQRVAVPGADGIAIPGGIGIGGMLAAVHEDLAEAVDVGFRTRRRYAWSPARFARDKAPCGGRRWAGNWPPDRPWTCARHARGCLPRCRGWVPYRRAAAPRRHGHPGRQAASPRRENRTERWPCLGRCRRRGRDCSRYQPDRACRQAGEALVQREVRGPRPRPPPLALAVSGLLLPPAGATACAGVRGAGAWAHSEIATANEAPTAVEINTEEARRFLTSNSPWKRKNTTQHYTRCFRRACEEWCSLLSRVRGGRLKGDNRGFLLPLWYRAFPADSVPSAALPYLMPGPDAWDLRFPGPVRRRLSRRPCRCRGSRRTWRRRYAILCR